MTIHTEPTIPSAKWPHPRRPGWPMNSTTTAQDRAIAASAAFVRSMEEAPATAVEALARDYIAAKGADGLQRFANALLQRVQVTK